ncbi:hypothetical protein ES703_117122 [subsurface metagenome]
MSPQNNAYVVEDPGLTFLISAHLTELQSLGECFLCPSVVPFLTHPQTHVVEDDYGRIRGAELTVDLEGLFQVYDRALDLIWFLLEESEAVQVPRSRLLVSQTLEDLTGLLESRQGLLTFAEMNQNRSEALQSASPLPLARRVFQRLLKMLPRLLVLLELVEGLAQRDEGPAYLVLVLYIPLDGQSIMQMPLRLLKLTHLKEAYTQIP